MVQPRRESPAECGIAASILDFIGNTPMMELTVGHEGGTWRFFAKLEFMNPTGSVKDRIARYIVEQAERRGEIKSDSVIVEATSGNTGIGLAMVCAVKGYKLVIVMPEHMSLERRKIMTSLGAEICLTPTAESFAGARARAEAMAARDPRVFLTRQFQNEDNIECHYRTTAIEILRQLAGVRVDAFVAGIGTGGTLMGVGRRLREMNPACKLVAVEPAEAAILSGCDKMAVHPIAGIGDGFIPEIVDVHQLDWTEAVPGAEAVAMAQEVARQYGIMVGVSSGANVLATINVLRRLGPDARVVTVLPDRSERYFSTELYAAKKAEVVRTCRKNCENAFCEFRSQT
ncbi:cysteine synthase A [candidate division WOR-3 bacterium]|nr:cysteine synthase A [candidate division WOR-3 bacterium]